MSNLRESMEAILRCSACNTLFEQGVADDLRGQPRCPQCGLAESAFADRWNEEEIVIRRTTPFR